MIPKLKNKKPPEPGKPIIPGVIDKGKSPYNSDDNPEMNTIYYPT
ncbi:unnamed protein product [marine sediment metagenome]|uniref:Uncharacterized protein n=1 Tax=marine sediment metagenome TaxID=412755 RepID=X1N4A5_9ZZZZ